MREPPAQETPQRPRSAHASRAVVTEFFERYEGHDIDAMTDLCTVDAAFDYVPVQFTSNKQVQQARGTVGSIGKVIWHGQIASFPDLGLSVHSMTANDDGDVVVQVDVRGTQQRAWGYVAPTGRSYAEPHLFILHVAEDHLIDSITAYWNEASVSQQLGHGEVD